MKHLHQHYHHRKQLLSTMLQRDMRQAASTVAQKARPQAEAAQGPGAQGGGRPHKRTVPHQGPRHPNRRRGPRCGLRCDPQRRFATARATKKEAPPKDSPALRRSTIGAAGLNFSVRDGKRWNPGAMATWICRAPWKWPRSSSATGGASRGKTGHAGRTGGAHKARRENLIRAGSFRAISSARLWRRRLYTCALSTS